MGDEAEFESFDFNDRDLDFALHRGPRRRQTKEQQIYGVWAAEEDEDARPGFGQSKGRSKGPVAFVSGGVAVGNKLEEEVIVEEADKSEASYVNLDAEDDAIEISMLPATKRTKFDSELGGGSRTQQSAFAGMRASTSSGQPDKWISPKIAKMMKLMGHVSGQGLGKNKQGIVEPVQAILRPGRGAVGAYGNETKGLKFGESAGDAQRKDEPPVEVRAEEAKVNAWKKTHAKKVKPRYVTLEEVVKERADYEQTTTVKQSTVKFIDMTGPEHKVYDSIHSFQQRVERPTRRPNFDVPALTENIDQLLMSCKQEIHRNNDHLQELKTKTAGLERDKSEMESWVRETEAEVNQLDGLTQIVNQFEHPQQRGLAVLDEYKSLFRRLRRDYPAEYQLYGLDSLVEFKVSPLLKEFFRSWRPLDEVEYGLAEVTEWRELVIGTHVFENVRLDTANVFDSLLWSAWMPSVRRVVLQWDPRTECMPMIELVATWSPILPTWIQDNLYDNVIVPRIRTKVDEWDPVSDEIPIDKWIAPWHEVLGDRLLGVFPTIRQKLAKALRMWKATDGSALAVIRPWSRVFSRGTMQGFLAANIVPKLERALAEMDMNPATNTKYDEFYAVLTWLELLSAEIVCQVLTRNFFPQWYENLCQWLRVPNALNEVMIYYREWKERVPPQIAEMDSIKAEFIRALRAIQQARSGLAITPMPNYEQSRPPPVQPIAAPTYPQPSASASFLPTSYRQVVEHRAQQLGIVFAPQPNRFHNGRAIWWFGEKSVYVDGTAIFLYDPDRSSWTPVGLEQLIGLV